MLPYFYELPELKLSKRLETELVLDCFKDIKKTSTDDYVGGDFYRHCEVRGERFFEKDPELVSLLNRCVLRPTTKLVMFYPPKYDAIKHIDCTVGRVTIIYFPIFPTADYAPLEFWKSYDDTVPVAQAGVNGNPLIFNAQEIHSAKNNSAYRINLQFSVTEPFEEVLKLAEEGKLFNSL